MLNVRLQFMALELSRRQLFRGVAYFGAAYPSASLAGNSAQPLFEEIPAASSVIGWVHDNAMSDSRDLPETLGPGCAFSEPVHYKEPLLFHQASDGKMINMSEHAGPVFQKNFPARGPAVGGYNNDGALVVLVANNGEAPLLLRNNAAIGRTWLGIRLEGVTYNRDAIRSRIAWKAGGKTFHRLKNNGGSYLSSHGPREIPGLASSAKVAELEIHWAAPGRRVEKFINLEANRYIHIVEGKGIV